MDKQQFYIISEDFLKHTHLVPIERSNKDYKSQTSGCSKQIGQRREQR